MRGVMLMGEVVIMLRQSVCNDRIVCIILLKSFCACVHIVNKTSTEQINDSQTWYLCSCLWTNTKHTGAGPEMDETVLTKFGSICIVFTATENHLHDHY